MKLLFIAPLLVLAGCTGTLAPNPARVDLAVNSAVIAEAGTRLRCPRSNLEWQAVRGVRMAFDLRYGGMLTLEQSERLGEARRVTDAACTAG